MILRSCTMGDLSLLEEWDANGEMWVGDKQAWLAKRIDDGSYCMFIGGRTMFNGSQPQFIIPVGWGGIKLEADYSVLSWFIAPAYRHSGNGIQLAELLAKMVDAPFKAKINANRPYSERIAIRLGMRPEGGLLETGEKWWVSFWQ